MYILESKFCTLASFQIAANNLYFKLKHNQQNLQLHNLKLIN